MPVHAAFLKYFSEVVASGSVRTAARRLHVSSSAVNRQILKIEGELGTHLFERRPGGMQLTAVGHVLARHIERTLADAERCHAEIAALGRPRARPLTIAGQESAITEFLPPVLVELHAALPGIGSAFLATGGDALNGLLRDGTADVAIAFDQQGESELIDTVVRELPVGAIVAPGHPLAGRHVVSVSDCKAYPLILPDRSWPLRALLDEMLAGHGAEATVVTTSNSVEFLRSMINQQLGVGFQTPMGLERRLASGELILIPLRKEEAVRQRLCIRVRADEHAAPLERLLTLLQDRLQTYADQWG